MKRAIILSMMTWAVLAAPALADMAGNTVLYNTGGALYSIPDVTKTSAGGFVGDQLIGSFGSGIGDMTDIAFDTNRTLYGVSFGSFYTINTAAGAATRIGAAQYPTNALANFAPGRFYAAIDGTNLSGFNGHFFVVDASTDTWTDKGHYTDAAGTTYLSAGDIWVTGDDVYATINNSSNSQGWVATVNPANAAVSLVAPLPGAAPGDMYGLTENANGDLLVYRSSGDVWKLAGSALVDTGFNTRAGAWGATAVPVPAAVLLGILGLGVAGLKLRKFV